MYKTFTIDITIKMKQNKLQNCSLNILDFYLKQELGILFRYLENEYFVDVIDSGLL